MCGIKPCAKCASLKKNYSISKPNKMKRRKSIARPKGSKAGANKSDIVDGVIAITGSGVGLVSANAITHAINKNRADAKKDPISGYITGVGKCALSLLGLIFTKGIFLKSLSAGIGGSGLKDFGIQLLPTEVKDYIQAPENFNLAAPRNFNLSGSRRSQHVSEPSSSNGKMPRAVVR